QWSTIVRREKETELFFRAEQIVKAIDSFYHDSSKSSQPYPRNFKVLLKDNRVPGLKRHLRKDYKDPMTKTGDWGIIYDGKGGIKGVFSKSNKKPFKKGNFPEVYKSFENKKKYSDWKFVHELKKETSS
ncbi:type II secretion system protein, partial [bacterium]|nr:type II secretion system protein [bacterium]